MLLVGVERATPLPQPQCHDRREVVTRHGEHAQNRQPIARLIPAGKHDNVASSARSTLLSRLEKQPLINAGRWTRDELYEDDQ